MSMYNEGGSKYNIIGLIFYLHQWKVAFMAGSGTRKKKSNILSI